MAKIDINVPYEVSAKQVLEDTDNRKIIPLTLSADIGLSGGIPLGGTILFGGRAKSGKTTMILQWIAYAQKLYKAKAFFFPVEGRLTGQTMKQVRGLNTDDLTVVRPQPIEDKTGKIIGYHKWNAQQWWKAIGEKIVNYPGSIIIVDSLSALSSEKEQSEGMGYQGRGDTQKLEAQFCRMYGDLIIPNNVTLILIAQVQANTSGYGPPLQIKAGNSISHQADVKLFCKSFTKWKENSDGKVLGQDIHLTVETSAFGAPFIDVDVPLRYGYGIDNIKDVITNAINWDIIKAAGAWYQLPFVEQDGKLVYTEETPADGKLVKIQGEQEVWNILSNPKNAAALEVLENKVRGLVLG